MHPSIVVACIIANMIVARICYTFGWFGFTFMVTVLPLVILQFCLLGKRHFFKIAVVSWTSFCAALLFPWDEALRRHGISLINLVAALLVESLLTAAFALLIDFLYRKAAQKRRAMNR